MSHNVKIISAKRYALGLKQTRRTRIGTKDTSQGRARVYNRTRTKLYSMTRDAQGIASANGTDKVEGGA